jgi:hypothetical protein
MASDMSAEESSQRLRMEFGAPLVGDTELQLLQRLCAGPISGPVHLGLLVAGTMVRGRLASAEAFGSYLDASLKAIADGATSARYEGEEAPPTAERADSTVLERLGETDFRRRAEQWRTEDERVDGALQEKDDELRRFDETLREGGADDDASLDSDQLPDEAIRDEYERWRKASLHLATEPVLTLTDATVLAAGQWLALGMVRVLVREVGAWWLSDAQE